MPCQNDVGLDHAAPVLQGGNQSLGLRDSTGTAGGGLPDDGFRWRLGTHTSRAHSAGSNSGSALGVSLNHKNSEPCEIISKILFERQREKTETKKLVNF